MSLGPLIFGSRTIPGDDFRDFLNGCETESMKDWPDDPVADEIIGTQKSGTHGRKILYDPDGKLWAVEYMESAHGEIFHFMSVVEVRAVEQVVTRYVPLGGDGSDFVTAFVGVVEDVIPNFSFNDPVRLQLEHALGAYNNARFANVHK